jgi:hypothetical protein
MRPDRRQGLRELKRAAGAGGRLVETGAAVQLGQAEIDTVAADLNNRPRKTLSWKTPAEALNDHLFLLP